MINYGNIIYINNNDYRKYIFVEKEKEQLIDTLKTQLLESRNYKKEVLDIILRNNSGKQEEYSKKVFDKLFAKKKMTQEDEQKFKLFQRAFIEMEGLFLNIKRKDNISSGFDHILGVVDILLRMPNTNIDHFIIGILHDGPEEIAGYNLKYVKKVYGEIIAKSIGNMTKKSNYYYFSQILRSNEINIHQLSYRDLEKMITRKKQKQYYGEMINWGDNELLVKFADRLDSLKSMEGIGSAFLEKKLYETKKYFLLDYFKEKVGVNLYKELKQEYIKLT